MSYSKNVSLGDILVVFLSLSCRCNRVSFTVVFYLAFAFVKFDFVSFVWMKLGTRSGRLRISDNFSRFMDQTLVQMQKSEAFRLAGQTSEGA